MSTEGQEYRDPAPRHEPPTLHEVCLMLTRLPFGDFVKLTRALSVEPDHAYSGVCHLEKETAPKPDPEKNTAYRSGGERGLRPSRGPLGLD